jgi:hypothetical protein
MKLRLTMKLTKLTTNATLSYKSESYKRKKKEKKNRHREYFLRYTENLKNKEFEDITAY